MHKRKKKVGRGSSPSSLKYSLDAPYVDVEVSTPFITLADWNNSTIENPLSLIWSFQIVSYFNFLTKSKYFKFN